MKEWNRHEVTKGILAPHPLYPDTQPARRSDCDPRNKAVEAQGGMQDDGQAREKGQVEGGTLIDESHPSSQGPKVPKLLLIAFTAVIVTVA